MDALRPYYTEIKSSWTRILTGTGSYLPSRLSTYSLFFFRLSWAERLLRIFRRIFFKILSSNLQRDETQKGIGTTKREEERCETQEKLFFFFHFFNPTWGLVWNVKMCIRKWVHLCGDCPTCVCQPPVPWIGEACLVNVLLLWPKASSHPH